MNIVPIQGFSVEVQNRFYTFYSYKLVFVLISHSIEATFKRDIARHMNVYLPCSLLKTPNERHPP